MSHVTTPHGQLCPNAAMATQRQGDHHGVRHDGHDDAIVSRCWTPRVASCISGHLHAQLPDRCPSSAAHNPGGLARERLISVTQALISA